MGFKTTEAAKFGGWGWQAPKSHLPCSQLRHLEGWDRWELEVRSGGCPWADGPSGGGESRQVQERPWEARAAAAPL